MSNDKKSWECSECGKSYTAKEWAKMKYDDICDKCAPAAKRKGIISESTKKFVEGFRLIRESLDEMEADTDISIPENPTGINTQVIEELTRIFTPVLMMEGGELSPDAIDAMASMVNESTLLQFSERDRMAQLQTTAVKLLAKANNSHHWQSFRESSKLRAESIAAMQEEFGGAGEDVSKQYLIHLTTTSDDEGIRQKAQKLLST